MRNLDTRGQAWDDAARQRVMGKPDLYRNPLHDTHKVPRCIVCGQQAERRPATRRKAVDHAFKYPVGIAVDRDAHALTGADMFELGFLEVRHDPHIIDRHDIEQRNTRRNEPADADLTVTDNAINRRVYHGAVEIDLGQIARGLCLRHSSNGSFSLGHKDGDALLLSLDRCRRCRDRRLGSGACRAGFIDEGLADRVADDQFFWLRSWVLVARFISAEAERRWASACRIRAR